MIGKYKVRKSFTLEIEEGYKEKLLGQMSRDSTVVSAREKPVPKPKAPKRKRGHPRKGEERP